MTTDSKGIWVHLRRIHPKFQLPSPAAFGMRMRDCLHHQDHLQYYISLVCVFFVCVYIYEEKLQKYACTTEIIALSNCSFRLFWLHVLFYNEEKLQKYDNVTLLECTFAFVPLYILHHAWIITLIEYVS